MNKTIRSLQPNCVEPWMKELEDKLLLVDAKIVDWAKQYAIGHIDHYKSVVEHVQRINILETVNRILDIGAVPGHISALLKYAGFSVQAIDIDPKRAQGLFESMNIPAHQVNVESEPLPFPDDSFDLVLFCEILEHLLNHPLKTIQEIYRVLEPRGNLVLSVPHITPLMRWRFLWGKDFQDDLVSEFAKLESIGHMGHFRLYSRDEIRRLLTHVGFRIIRVETGGKLKTQDKHWDARIFQKLACNQMHSQLYVWAKK